MCQFSKWISLVNSSRKYIFASQFHSRWKWFRSLQCLNPDINLFQRTFHKSARMLASHKTETSRKKYARHNHSTINDKEAANKLLEHLNNDISESDILIEIDPGNGVLTKLLLSSLNNKIILFKPSTSLQDDLKCLFVNKIENIVFSPLSIHDAQKYFYRSQVFENHSEYSNFLQTLQQDYSETSQLRLIGAISSPSLLYIIMLNFAHQNMFYGSMKTSLLVYVSPSIFTSLMKNSKSVKKWRLGIFANLCFNVNHLTSLSANCFNTAQKLKLSESEKNQSNSCFHLVKFTPRDYIGSSDIIKVDTIELAHFFYFVNYFIRLRSDVPLIAALDSFIPSIGKEMIKDGFKVYCRPQFLTNDEWVKAYKTFSSHPNYLSSPFLKMMTDQFAKIGYFDSELDDEYNLEENIS